MALLIVGLVIFLGVHSVRIVADEVEPFLRCLLPFVEL